MDHKTSGSTNTATPITLVESIYNCLDANLRTFDQLKANEIGDFHAASGRNDDNIPGNEKRLIYRLSRLIMKDGEGLLSETSPGRSYHGNIVRQISGLYDTPGKRPYYEVMDKNKLYVSGNFLEKIKAALNNPMDKGRTHWPEAKANVPLYAKLIKEVADFDASMKEEPSKNRLYKAIYDPMLKDKLIDDQHQQFQEEKTIDSALRPKIIYLGGLYFGGGPEQAEEATYVNRAMRRIKFVLDPTIIPTDQYDIYVATYHNDATVRKLQYTQDYLHDPEHFASPYAKGIVQDCLKPLLARKAEGGPWEKLDADTLNANLSMVTFMGYSYGTHFVQEVRNAMKQEMETLGYSGNEIKTALKKVAAINIGPRVSIIDKSAAGDFTQFFTAAEGDHVSMQKSNIADLVSADPNPHVKQYRFMPDGELTTLATLGFDVPERLISYKTESLFTAEEMASMKGAPRVSVVSKRISVPNGERHNLDGFLRATRLRNGDDTFTLAANPASYAVRAFMQQQMQGSIDVANGTQATRNAPAILADVAHTHLSPTAIFDDVTKTNTIRSRLEQESSDRGLGNPGR